MLIFAGDVGAGCAAEPDAAWEQPGACFGVGRDGAFAAVVDDVAVAVAVAVARGIIAGIDFG